MIDRNELIQARNLIGKQFHSKENLELKGTDEYHRLCVIAGELDILIKNLKNENLQN